MVDSAIGIAECPTPTKFVDNEELVTSFGTVQRQRVSDPETHQALADTISSLQDILTQLQGTLDVNVTDASITVEIGNEVEIKNDAGNPVPVTGTVSVNEPVTVDGTVDLGAVTLAALETIHAVVDNWPTDFPDAAVLAKLEAIRALIDGTLDVAVTNFPSSTEISNDVGNPVPVTGTVSVNEPVTVDGTVAVSGEVEVKNDSGSPLAVTGTVSVNEPVTVDGEVGNLYQLVPEEYDEIALGYTGDNLTTAIFKKATVTVATVVLSYTGDRLDGAVRT